MNQPQQSAIANAQVASRASNNLLLLGLGGWAVGLFLPLWVVLFLAVGAMIMLAPHAQQAYKVRDRIMKEVPEAAGRLAFARYAALLAALIFTGAPMVFGAVMIIAAPTLLRKWFPSKANIVALEPSFFRLVEVAGTVITLVLYAAYVFVFHIAVPGVIENGATHFMTSAMPGITIVMVLLLQAFAYVFFLGGFGAQAARMHADAAELIRQYLHEHDIPATAENIETTKAEMPRLWNAAIILLEETSGVPSNLAKDIASSAAGVHSGLIAYQFIGQVLLRPGVSALMASSLAEGFTATKYRMPKSFNPFIRGSKRAA